MDSETNDPIPFVTIGVIHENNGTVSDEEGRFEINSQSKKDSIIVSSIGYETKRICLMNISEENRILMCALEYAIEETQTLHLFCR